MSPPPPPPEPSAAARFPQKKKKKSLPRRRPPNMSEFEEWMQIYKKVYKDPAEKKRRFKNFQDNAYNAEDGSYNLDNVRYSAADITDADCPKCFGYYSGDETDEDFYHMDFTD